MSRCDRVHRTLLPLLCRFFIRLYVYFSLFSFLLGLINRTLEGRRSLSLLLFSFALLGERVSHELCVSIIK
jgi:hypothetical protein